LKGKGNKKEIERQEETEEAEENGGEGYNLVCTYLLTELSPS
jgi:hypothetical protein